MSCSYPFFFYRVPYAQEASGSTVPGWILIPYKIETCSATMFDKSGFSCQICLFTNSLFNPRGSHTIHRLEEGDLALILNT